MRRILVLIMTLAYLLCLGAQAEVLPESVAGNAVDRALAEEIMRKAYPGCRILFARDEGAYKCLGVVSEDFCGTLLVSEAGIHSVSLKEDKMMGGGVLTMAGALEVLRMYRPEAEFRALELDEDDGLLIYEGEALLESQVYEFELDAESAKLLEWERDD